MLERGRGGGSGAEWSDYVEEGRAPGTDLLATERRPEEESQSMPCLREGWRRKHSCGRRIAFAEGQLVQQTDEAEGGSVTA